MAREYEMITSDPEQRQLIQLLQIAQLHKLLSEPQQEQQQLDQNNEQHHLAAVVQLLNLHQEMQNQDEQRRLQELNINETAKSREDTIKLGILHSLVSDPMTPTETKMKFAASISPEMAALVKADHAEKVASAVKTHLAGFKSVAAQGKPEALDAFKTMNQIPDEAWEQMKTLVPPTVTKPTTPIPNASQIAAKAVKNLTGPGLLYGLGQTTIKAAQNLPGTKSSFTDFYNELLK